MSTPTPSAPNKLQKLRESFIGQLPAQLEAIREMLAALGTTEPPAEKMEDFHRAIHSLKGSSAAFGLKGLSAVTAEAEDLAKEVMNAGWDPASPWRETMKERLAQVEKAIQAVGSGQETDPVRLDLAAAEAIHSGADRKRIYLCEDDPFQLSSLTTQIGCFGFEVTGFAKLEEFQAAVDTSAPDAIVMDMVHPGRRTGGAQIVERIRAGGGRGVPVVFISMESDMGSRLAAVRVGCDAYFVKPADPTELCATLHALTSNEKPEPYRIVIVEDDSHLSEMYGTILHEAGMETRTLTDPMQALPLLREFQPDLVLMDMHMPGCSGLELAAVIRQMKEYLSIPIVFLSGETDPDLQFDARRKGGDEFLHKTIKPEHLVAAVAVRAQRMKLLRSFMVRDSMTGLFNHSSIKEHLDIAVTRAQRAGENVCFAMIDLDHFKGVNDRYGHAAGDKVLVAMANLLRQRLRKSDIIGRYGGEELAVILPGSSMQEAVALMDQLRRCFENIRFPVGEDTFTVTFSCGVASLESHDNPEKLCLAADQSLYTAKKEGRNRVVAAGRFISTTQLKAMRVLVVDDAPPILAILVNMLEQIGFAKISTANNGQEAWNVLKAGRVDLVIADWHMPRMNGFELLKAVRGDSALSGLPFVMITSESDKKSVREAILAGVSEYILKPVYSEELSNKIIRALCKPPSAAAPAPK